MPIDTSIYSNMLAAPKSMVEYANEYALADQRKNQNAIQALQLKQAASVDAQRNALRSAIQGGQLNLNDPNGQSQALAVAPDVAPGLIKTLQDTNTSGALAKKDLAQAGNFDAESSRTTQTKQWESLQHGIQALTAASNPDQAKQAVMDGASKGYFSAQDAQNTIASIPTDPQAYQDWRLSKLKQILPAADMLKANSPVLSMRNIGGSTDTIASDPLTGATRVVNSVGNTVSPDTAMNAQTSRANNAANIAKDYRVAGLDASGNLVSSQSGGAGVSPAQGIIDAIGKNRVSESVALQRVPPAMKSAILNGVMQQYPDYVPGQFDAQKHAIQSFGTGPLGQQIQSGNTALNHLQTLRELATAQANSNTPLFNQIANRFAAETGQSAPTDLKSALTMVGPEITKAVVGAGGGVGDRENTESALSSLSKGSPAQAAGTLNTIEEIFGGRLSELGRTYERTTGQKNFVDILSPASKAVYDRKTGQPGKNASPVPDDIAAILAKHGAK